MVEHSAVNRVAADSSPTRGGMNSFTKICRQGYLQVFVHSILIEKQGTKCTAKVKATVMVIYWFLMVDILEIGIGRNIFEKVVEVLLGM